MILFPIIVLGGILKLEREKNNRLLFWFIFFMFFLFSSLRYNIGYDYRNYVLRIYGMPNFNQLSLAREFFSYILFWLSHYFENPQIFFSVNALITNYFVFKVINEYSNDKAKSIWIYLTFPMFFLNSLSIVRNFTAFALVFYSHKFILDKDFKRFLMCIFMAGLFHNSAFLIIPIYWLNDLKLTWKKIFISLLIVYISVPIVKIAVSYFLPSYSWYFSSDNNMQAGRATLLVLIVILIISLYYYEQLLEFDSKNNFYINSLFYAVLIYTTYRNFSHFAFRTTEYLYIFIILLVPDIFKILRGRLSCLLRPKQKTYVDYILLVFFYLSFLAMYFYLIKVGGEFYYPYRCKILKFFDSNYHLPFVR